MFASLAAAVLIGIPLGIAAARHRAGSRSRCWWRRGLVQTIPSLALLAFLIPLTGTIGVWPALIALFLYALLPITRNTHAGLLQVPAGLVQAGTALGLRRARSSRSVELPLAAPTIMAGIKTSAVINVGTATIAAFIGAGGFGERIVAGPRAERPRRAARRRAARGGACARGARGLRAGRALASRWPR